MSRSLRSPRTRTRVVPSKRKELVEEAELQDALAECTNCVFVTEGYKCPECGEVSTPNMALEYVRTQERLYGTAYGNGRYNDGIGERVYGKSDFKRKMDAKGLRVRERGEASEARASRKRHDAKARAELSRVVGDAVRTL